MTLSTYLFFVYGHSPVQISVISPLDYFIYLFMKIYLFI